MNRWFSIKVQLTVALVVRKRASWLMLETSGELFIINLTLEIGREMFFLLVDVWSSLSGVFWDIFMRTRRQTGGTSSIVLNCDAFLLLRHIKGSLAAVALSYRHLLEWSHYRWKWLFIHLFIIFIYYLLLPYILINLPLFYSYMYKDNNNLGQLASSQGSWADKKEGNPCQNNQLKT